MSPAPDVINALRSGRFEVGTDRCVAENTRAIRPCCRRLRALSRSRTSPRWPFVGANDGPKPPCGTESPANPGFRRPSRRAAPISDCGLTGTTISPIVSVIPGGALAGRHGGGDGISLVLVGARRHVLQSEPHQALPAPGRSGSGATHAVPAGPRGGRENLDDLDPVRGERVEEEESLDDPGVVGARAHLPSSGVQRMPQTDLAS